LSISGTDGVSQLRVHSARILIAVFAAAELSAQSPPRSFIRVNQLGYLTDAPKTAVVCSLDQTTIGSFTVQDAGGRVVFGPRKAVASGAFGPCAQTHRLDFSAFRKPGRYTIVAGGTASPSIRIGRGIYAGAADTLLYYMREQRSGFNPLIKDSVHKYDGIIVDHPTRNGEYIAVSGGWADASE
jgi:hypothetical protein